MRRLRLRCLAAVLVAVAAIATGAEAGTTAETSPAPRAVLVLDPGGCPGTRTLRLCEGFERALESTGMSGRALTPTFREDPADVLGLLARQRYSVVITFGLGFLPALRAVAARHPGQRFVLMDSSRTQLESPPNNVQGIVFRTSEAAYLAGWLAGKLEARDAGRDVVGVVGGAKVPVVDDVIVGFRAGARRAVPGIDVLVGYSGDFVDETKCAAIARQQIARGAGVLFNVAGGCGLGTMSAAEDAGIWVVGADSDQSFLGPHVLTSVLRRFDAGFLAVLRQVKAGRVVTGRDTVLTLRDGAVGLGRISPKVPQPLVRQLDVLRLRIVGGAIRVPGVLR